MTTTTHTDTTTARKHTKFMICEGHASRFAGTGRYRTAEMFSEGGPATGEGCTGPTGCTIAPGTDLYFESLCHDTWNTYPGSPFAWAANRESIAR